MKDYFQIAGVASAALVLTAGTTSPGCREFRTGQPNIEATSLEVTSLEVTSTPVSVTFVEDPLLGRFEEADLRTYRRARLQLLQILRIGTERFTGWREPAANLGSDGEIELEWRNGRKSLELILDGKRMFFLQAWGDIPSRSFEDGQVCSIERLGALWDWLRK